MDRTELRKKKCAVSDADASGSAWVCGRALSRIAGSNHVRGIDDRLLWVLCAVRSGRSLVQRSPTECDVSNRVWSWSLENEDALAQLGLLLHWKKLRSI